MNANQRANKRLWAVTAKEVETRNYFWTVEGGVAVLNSYEPTFSHETPPRYNEESLKLVLANVKRNRTGYGSEKNHAAEVQKFEEGLATLQTALARSKK
jgi:hypothetical protein